MAYDQKLTSRIREKLGGIPGLEEKKMFGGVGFLIRGNMACGVNGDELIVRVGPQQDKAALSRPHTRPFDMTGRPMQGWVMVAPAGVAKDSELQAWIDLGVAFAETLPEK